LEFGSYTYPSEVCDFLFLIDRVGTFLKERTEGRSIELFDARSTLNADNYYSSFRTIIK